MAACHAALAHSPPSLVIRDVRHGATYSGSDEITLDLGLTEGIGLVRQAVGVVRSALAHAGAARVGHDGRVDGDDVSHSEEGGQAAADLGEEVRALALPSLYISSTISKSCLRRYVVDSPLLPHAVNPCCGMTGE